MNKRQKKKKNKNWNKYTIEITILPFYKENDDGTMSGIMYYSKKGKIVKAYELKNTRITSVGNSCLAESNESNVFTLNWSCNQPGVTNQLARITSEYEHMFNNWIDGITHQVEPESPCIISSQAIINKLMPAGYSNLSQPNEINETILNLHQNPCDGTHINMLMNATANALKDKILSEINPQIWEYGGIKRLEYLFFRYCVQWYTFHYKEWPKYTMYDLAEQYIELYPKNNFKQLLYYIRKWQSLRICNYMLLPYAKMGGTGGISCMIRQYKKIWNNTIDISKRQEVKYYEALFRSQEEL